MRPRKLLFIVSFKCSRVEVFYLLDNTGLEIREGDIVIVEADRGQDLGTVQHANVTQDEAKLYKRKYAEEQYKWLMMFSRNNEPSNINPNAQLYGESSATGAARGNNILANAPSTMMGQPRENFNNLKPKAIKRLASAHEIRMLGEKEGNEAKAKRTCQQKVAHLHLQMEILDAEWQWYVTGCLICSLDRQRGSLANLNINITGTSRNSSFTITPIITSTSKTLSLNCTAFTRRVSGYLPSTPQVLVNMPRDNCPAFWDLERLPPDLEGMIDPTQWHMGQMRTHMAQYAPTASGTKRTIPIILAFLALRTASRPRAMGLMVAAWATAQWVRRTSDKW